MTKSPFFSTTIFCLVRNPWRRIKVKRIVTMMLKTGGVFWRGSCQLSVFWSQEKLNVPDISFNFIIHHFVIISSAGYPILVKFLHIWVCYEGIAHTSALTYFTVRLWSSLLLIICNKGDDYNCSALVSCGQCALNHTLQYLPFYFFLYFMFFFLHEHGHIICKLQKLLDTMTKLWFTNHE